MRCFYCNKSSEDSVGWEGRTGYYSTVDEYIKIEWISYNSELDTFACDECLNELDLPVFGQSWYAGKALTEEELFISYRGE